MAVGMRRFGVGFLMLLVLWVAALAAAPPASAHAVLVSTSPGDGQLVAVPPEHLTLTFSESVEAGLATVRLFNPYGEQVPTPRPINPGGRTDTIAVPMAKMAFMGTYTVSWRVLSSDTHPVSGAFTFHLGTPMGPNAAVPPVQDEGSTTVEVLYGAARLAAFAALALLVGATLFVAAWWPGGARHPALGRLIWSAWAVLVAATVAVLLLFGPQAAARPLSGVADPSLLTATLQTRLGEAMLLRVLVLSLAAPALALLLSRASRVPRAGTHFLDRRGWWIGAVLGGAAALAVTWSIAGHSVVGPQAALAVSVDVVHLCAMGVWLGGLVVLCLVLLRTTETEAMRSAVPAFSQVALVCVVVLVVTGSYQAWRQVGSPAALVTTTYGWLLLGKVLLVLLLIGVGATSRSWVRRHYATPHTGLDVTPDAVLDPVAGAVPGAVRSAIAIKHRPRPGPDRSEVVRFRRVVAAEVGLAAVVLGVTTVLVTSPPARTAQIHATAQDRSAQERAAQERQEQRAEQAGAPTEQWPTPVSARVAFDTGSGPGGQGVVEVTTFPAGVGPNQIHLSVLDPAGTLLDVAEVTATLNLPDRALGPLAVSLQQLGPGHYTGSTTIPMSGRWQLAVAVRTSDIDQDTVTIPIDVR